MSNDIKDQLYTKVTLVISIDDRKRAESILKALIPDNVNIPQSLEMEFKLSNNNDSANLVLEFKARCNDDKSIRTLASTIDEVLEHIDVMNKVLNSKGA
jgi:tRNA threonylcarbamoyladenosine modification (KEOPS) complex  Pcc1 subunit